MVLAGYYAEETNLQGFSDPTVLHREILEIYGWGKIWEIWSSRVI
jgi:hypothetical protein